MKEGWEYKKLGEVATFINGDRSANYPSKKDYVVDGIPFVNAGNLIQAGLDSASLNLISQNKYDSLSQGKFVEGDILFCLRGTLGKHSIVQNGLKGAIASSLVIIRTKDGFCNKYISYYLDYKQPFIERLNNGAAQPNIPAKTMKGFSIPVPPLSEQQSIVDYLDSAFAKIDAMKANAEKALNEAKALFQASLKEMLEPKEGWEEKELKDIVDTKCPISYGIVQQGDHVDGGIPVVRPVDLYRKYITSSNLKCTTQSISYSYKRTILRGDEILLGVRGTTGLVGIATEELKGSNVNRGIVPLFFKDGIYRDFIYYEMLSPAMQSVFAEKTTGATLKQINIKDLRTISFSYPVFEVQQQIVDTLDSLKSKVDRLQENYNKISQECDALKQAILRKVFE